MVICSITVNIFLCIVTFVIVYVVLVIDVRLSFFNEKIIKFLIYYYSFQNYYASKFNILLIDIFLEAKYLTLYSI